MTRPSKREIERELDEVAGKGTSSDLEAALAEIADTRMLADGSIVFVDAGGDPIDFPGDGPVADFSGGDI